MDLKIAGVFPQKDSEGNVVTNSVEVNALEPGPGVVREWVSSMFAPRLASAQDAVRAIHAARKSKNMSIPLSRHGVDIHPRTNRPNTTGGAFVTTNHIQACLQLSQEREQQAQEKVARQQAAASKKAAKEREASITAQTVLDLVKSNDSEGLKKCKADEIKLAANHLLKPAVQYTRQDDALKALRDKYAVSSAGEVD